LLEFMFFASVYTRILYIIPIEVVQNPILVYEKATLVKNE